MAAAVYLWILLSAALMALAMAGLARFAGEVFQLQRPWRVALLALAAVCPLVSFGLEFGNVSVIVAALCIRAVTAPRGVTPWLSGAGLGAAVLLKPHLAIWVAVPLALTGREQGRNIVQRAALCCAGVVLLAILWAAMQSPPLGQFTSYRAMVASEVSSGSMAAGNHELMEVAAQITSLGSLLAYWLPEATARRALEIVVLCLMGAGLGWSSWRLRCAQDATRMEVVAAWCAFGMIATYHRAHDGMVLLLLQPTVLMRLHTSWRDAWAWCTLGLFAAMSAGLAPSTLAWLAAQPYLRAASQLLLYRQASLAALLLAMLLLTVIVRAAWEEVRPEQ